jgi:hypothetical protein
MVDVVPERQRNQVLMFTLSVLGEFRWKLEPNGQVSQSFVKIKTTFAPLTKLNHDQLI